ELAAPVGSCASSLHLLRDTIVAVGARLVVALGGVAVRATIAAAGLEAPRPARGGEARVTLPTLARLQKAGIERGRATAWPEHVAADEAFLDDWRRAWGDAPLPHILWLTHPSAQNMSPFARVETAFHGRMVEARDALRRAAREVLGRTPPSHRPATPVTGIYALPEWRERIAPRYERRDRLWRENGVCSGRDPPWADRRARDWLRLCRNRLPALTYWYGLLRSRTASTADPDRAGPPGDRRRPRRLPGPLEALAARAASVHPLPAPSGQPALVRR